MRGLHARLAHTATAPAIDHRTDIKHFARHGFEMTAAMLLGMAILGALFREVHVLVFGTGFDDLWHRHTELAVFGMTFNMTVPMVAWMRHRGHAWRPCAEMAAAMFVLALGLLVLFWVGALSADTVLPLEMALMLPRHDPHHAPALRRVHQARQRREPREAPDPAPRTAGAVAAFRTRPGQS